MTHPYQRLAQLPKALGGPPQRRLGIPARGRIDKPVKIPYYLRIGLDDRPSPPTSTPHLATIKPLSGLKLVEPSPDCLLHQSGHASQQRDPSQAVRPGLARRPQPAATLIALRAEQPPTFSNPRLRHTIEHCRQSLRLRHANPFSIAPRTPSHNTPQTHS